MLVAHVVTAAGGGILRGSRKLQHDLLDRSVLALRQRLDGVVADRGRRRAGGRVDGVEALIEGRCPGRELLRRRSWGAAGGGVERAPPGQERRYRGRLWRLGFGFAARTTTSGSSTCAAARPMQQISASTANPRGNHAQKTRRTECAENMNRHDARLIDVHGVAKRPATGGRAVAAHHEMEGRASILCAFAGPERGNGEDQQRPMRQARRRSARLEWRARVAKKMAVTELKCSTDRVATGTGSCGACGRNEVAVRWIVAQIAQ